MSVLYTSGGARSENVLSMPALPEHLSVEPECRNYQHANRFYDGTADVHRRAAKVRGTFIT